MMSSTKTLRQLLEGFPRELWEELCLTDLNAEVQYLTSDSRAVRAGTVFVAHKGVSQDGHQFIDQACAQGAIAIVGEAPAPAKLPVPYVRVADGRVAMAKMAGNFYDNPSHSLLMIGVTGTSGKTTTTYLLESIFQAAGHRVGVIGTVNFRFGTQIFESTHTTPGSVELQRLLSEMKKAGCTTVVMEVSSHALKQHRTGSIAFDGMIFTNLSPEHLDYHPDMEDYFRSKALLFKDMVDASIVSGKKPVAVINADDDYGRRLVTELKAKSDPGFRFHTFGMESGSDFAGDCFQISLAGIEGNTRDGIHVKSGLTGRFNGYNMLGAIALARGLGLDPEAISEGASRINLVPGRLERVANRHGIHVLVDYAHKPDALEKVLKTLVDVRGENRLITVFGCGGDRDRKKRPVMGKIATDLSDHVFVTSDNPRTENPNAIIEEIKAGIPSGRPYQVEPDRKKAIFAAIAIAKKGDIVLIAGKGHEDYQIIADPGAQNGTRKIHFDDREVATEALGALC